MKHTFIETTNKESAETLLQNGLELIIQTSNRWVFANDGFDLKTNRLKNTTYSDKLIF